MKNDSIKKEVVFTSNIEKVWQAISNGEEISRWFLKADFKAQVGYNYTFMSHEDDCDPIIGEVKSADPYELIYTWIVKGTDVETTVSWKLEATESGTKLILEHSGISNYGAINAVKMFTSFDGGWDNCINGLNSFLKN